MSTGVFSGNSVGDDGIRPFPHIAFDWSDGIIQMASRAYIAGWKAMNPYLLSLQFGSDHTRAHRRVQYLSPKGKATTRLRIRSACATTSQTLSLRNALPLA